jgi:hypothetical protein
MIATIEKLHKKMEGYFEMKEIVQDEKKFMEK